MTNNARAMRRRPLIALSLFLIVGIVVGRWTLGVLPPVLWPALGSALLLIALLLRSTRASWAALLTGFLALSALGAWLYQRSDIPASQWYPRLEGLTAVQGWVISYTTQRPDRTSFVLQAEGLPGRLQVFYYHRNRPFVAIAYGDRLRLRGVIEVPWQFPDFDYREYLRQRGIWAIVSLGSARQIEKLQPNAGGGLNPVLLWGYRQREELLALIDRYLPATEAGLLKGLLLGERTFMSPDLEQSFRDAGVMHVLAVSGMNLGMILVALCWPLRRLRLTYAQIYLVTVPAVLYYLVVVGFEVSLWRAAVVFFFVTVGYVFAERGWILRCWIDPLQGLAAAAIVICLITPSAPFDVSFQLSFAATGALLLVVIYLIPKLNSRYLDQRRFWVKALTSFLLVSAAAQIGVIPVIAHHFQRVYLWVGLLANCLVVPWVTLALWVALALLGTAALGLSPVAAGLGAVESVLLTGLARVAEFFAGLPGAYVNLKS